MHRQLGTYVLYEKNFFRHVPCKSKKWSRIKKVQHALRNGGLQTWAKTDRGSSWMDIQSLQSS